MILNNFLTQKQSNDSEKNKQTYYSEMCLVYQTLSCIPFSVSCMAGTRWSGVEPDHKNIMSCTKSECYLNFSFQLQKLEKLEHFEHDQQNHVNLNKLYKSLFFFN